MSSRFAAISDKQPRHLDDGAVEDVEEELGRDADGEHEKGDRNYYPLLVRPELGKSDTGFDERAAEKRLHRAHKNNGSEEKTDYRHRGKRGSNSEGTFEDEKFADKSVQSGQSERGKHRHAHPAAKERGALHQSSEIIDTAQAASLLE